MRPGQGAGPPTPGQAIALRGGPRTAPDLWYVSTRRRGDPCSQETGAGTAGAADRRPLGHQQDGFREHERLERLRAWTLGKPSAVPQWAHQQVSSDPIEPKPERAGRARSERRPMKAATWQGKRESAAPTSVSPRSSARTGTRATSSATSQWASSRRSALARLLPPLGRNPELVEDHVDESFFPRQRTPALIGAPCTLQRQ